MNMRTTAFPRRAEVLALLVGSFLGLAVCAPGSAVAQALDGTSRSFSQASTMKIRLIVGEQVATATLYDNATAKDFASLLPLSLTMTDYDTIERVSDLPRKLSMQGAPAGMAPVAGELTHYAPWGNLAIFIQPRSYSRDLVPLGRIDEGRAIVSQPGPYKMRIEPIEP
jgi:hypothetical protein